MRPKENNTTPETIATASNVKEIGLFKTLPSLSISAQLTAIFQLILVLLTSRVEALGAGVTVITHGQAFQNKPGAPDWTSSMAREIAAKAGTPWENVSLYRIVIEQAGFSTEPRLSLFEKVDGPDEISSGSGEIIVLLDWAEVAGILEATTQQIARIVLPTLVNDVRSSGLDAPLAELPLHLIGHSRGGSVMSELAGLLAEQGIWVDHLTTLDPHPVRPPCGTDAEVRLFSSVVFADNYFRSKGDILCIPRKANPDGVNVIGAYNRELDEAALAKGGYGISHSNVHLWYFGTIDPETPTTDGEANIIEEVRTQWYLPSEDRGASTGYFFSRIMGGRRMLAGLGKAYQGNAERITPSRISTAPWPNAMLEYDEDGQRVSYWYSTVNNDSTTIRFGTDKDRNPYNGLSGNEITQLKLAKDSTRLTLRASFPWVPKSEEDKHYLYAKITDGIHTRYYYVQKPLRVVDQGDVLMDGNVSYNISGNTVNLKVDRVSNNRKSGQSGTLRLELWACPTPYSGGALPAASRNLGIYQFTGVLQGSGTYANVDVNVAYTRPPDGSYYIVLFLTEYTGGSGSGYTIRDYRTFSNQLVISPPPANLYASVIVKTGGGRSERDLVNEKDTFVYGEQGGLFGALSLNGLNEEVKAHLNIKKPDGTIGFTYDWNPLLPGDRWLWYGWDVVPNLDQDGRWIFEWSLDRLGDDKGFILVAVAPFNYRHPPSIIISMSGDLSFGNVTVGTSAQRTVTIRNDGNSQLTVSNIGYPNGFSGNWSRGVIEPGSSRDVTVTFSPTTTTGYTGNLTVDSNATSGTNTKPLSGIGTLVNPPHVSDEGQMVNGFQDGFDSSTRDPHWVVFGPGGDLYQQSGGVLHVRVSSGDPNHLLYVAPAYSSDVQEVLARIRITAFGTGDPFRAGIGVGVDPSSDASSANFSRGLNLLFREFTQDNVSSRQFKFLDDLRNWGPPGLRNLPGQATPGWEINTWYWMRLRLDSKAGGNNYLFGKVWLADGVTSEPGNWQMTWGDIDSPIIPKPLRTGYAGITGSSLDGVAEFDVDYILIKATGLPQIKVKIGPPPAGGGIGDFNGDGRTDLLWRHTTGAVGFWFMQGTTRMQSIAPFTVPNGWQMKATGDFNNDGQADIVWQHGDSSVAYWLMKGTQIAEAIVPYKMPSGWDVVAGGTFNGDKQSDLVLQHQNSAVAIWLLNGVTMSSGVIVDPSVVGWRVTGSGDFDGDGQSDVLLRHNDGTLAVWLMNGTTIRQAIVLRDKVPSNWLIKATGDFNLDGQTDIVLQSSDNRSVAFWLMNGTTVRQGIVPYNNLDSNWIIAGPK